MTCACLHYSPADPLVQRYGLGAAAFRYQRQLYEVLPLVRGGKRPHRMLGDRGGVHHADTGQWQAEQWWSQDPAANIGAATGSVSRLAVIDLDVKHGKDGPAELARFLHGDWPATFSQPWMTIQVAFPQIALVRTPSGGWHIWLRTPPGAAVPERPGILPGVDVKGDGGLVVVPPSMLLVPAPSRPGEPRGSAEVPVPYSWAAGCPCTVPDAPPWLLPWLASAPASGSPQGNHGGGENAEAPHLASLKRTGIPRGERNATLYRLACSLYRERGISTGASVSVKEDMMEIWQKSDRTDFSPGELLTIIDSARRFISGEMQKEEVNRDKFRQWMGSN